MNAQPQPASPQYPAQEKIHNNQSQSPFTSNYNNPPNTIYGQQQPYQSPTQSYPQQPYYNNPYDDHDDGSSSISLARGMSLVTVGGLIGVSAAAAIRWLNGGDFELFPSPPQQQQQNIMKFQIMTTTED